MRVLDAMGHGLRRLVELPPAPKGLGDGWDEVTRRIAAGTSRLAADPSVAIGEARIATERLLEIIGRQIAAAARRKRECSSVLHCAREPAQEAVPCPY